MIDIEKIINASLIDIYLFSNTPVFLLEKFSNHPTVINLSREESIDDIYKNLQGILLKSEFTLKEVVYAYALLIALIVALPNDKKDRELKLDLSKLEWGNYIVNISDYYSIPTTISIFKPLEIKPKIITISPVNSSHNNITFSINKQKKNEVTDV